MLHIRNIVLIFIYFHAFFFHAFSQQNKATLQAIDIFSDLPINDPTVNSKLGPGESAENKIRENIFVSALLNKSSCYIGEPVLLNFELLSALNSTSTIQKLPSFVGFMTIEMEENNDFPKFRKKNGLSFSVFTVKKIQLIPGATGDFEIDPISIFNTVNYKNGKSNNSYTGSVSSKPVRLAVKQLPVDGKPIDFSGNMGDFIIKASVQKDSLPAGESNSLILEITGSGNFISLKQPTILWPGGFEYFDFTEKSDIDYNVFPAKGTRVISIPFIADHPGVIRIPSIVLNYFNPAVKKYLKSETGDIQFVVLPAISNSGKKVSVTGNITNRSGVKNVWLTYLLIVILLCSVILIIIYVIRKRNKNIHFINELAARKKEIAQMEAEAEKQRQNGYKLALANLEKAELNADYMLKFKTALVDYIRGRMNCSSLIQEEIIESLKIKDIATGLEVKQLLVQSEMFIYAGILPDRETKKNMLLHLNRVVARIEQL